MASPARARARPGLGVRGAVMLVVVVAVLAGWIYVSRRSAEEQAPVVSTATILSQIPSGAMLVATVDVAALRNTPLGEQLLGQGRSVAGLGEVTGVCGRDPMDDVERMAIAIPDAGQDTGFGLFATGSIQAEELIGCAETIVSQRGGRPVRVSSGRFTVLKDASLELSSAELAAADGGPVILAEPSYVRAALGVEPSSSVNADPDHASLRRLVPPGQLVATAVLSASQRRALLDELRAQNQANSPFRAVTGAALTLSVTAQLELAVVIRCDEAEACARVAEHVVEAAKAESSSRSARAIGLDLVLDRMRVETRGDAVFFGVTMPAEQALSMLRQALALRKLASELPPEPTPQPPPAEDDVGDAGVRIEAKPPTSATPRP